ncbi:hypothetical protein [Roseibium sp.]|uniref:hypothetical protein n=1 Tax=Roseibium sp. TaxID=1936156 RepID=UPI003A985A9A
MTNDVRTGEEQLQSLDAEIDRARKKMAEGSPSHKVEAAGELTVLEKMHQDLADKLKAATKQHAENWTLAHEEIRKDIESLYESLDRWVMKYSKPGV